MIVESALHRVKIGSMNRRILLGDIGVFLAGFKAPKAQSRNRDRDPIFQHDLPDLSLHDWSVTTVEVDYAPGESSKAHRHPGLTVDGGAGRDALFAQKIK
jgi:hypothetical protein